MNRLAEWLYEKALGPMLVIGWVGLLLLLVLLIIGLGTDG